MCGAFGEAVDSSFLSLGDDFSASSAVFYQSCLSIILIQAKASFTNQVTASHSSPNNHSTMLPLSDSLDAVKGGINDW